MERLDKMIAGSGVYSRREVKALVRSGRVSVDGATASAADMKVADGAVIAVDGQALACAAYAYILLHKPAGVLSATEDTRQKTVLDLLPEHFRRRGLAPVGRLDKDTEGLLLLTDDGELTHRLLSPKYHVDKIYLARVDGVPDGEDAAAFAAGITLPDGTLCRPATLQPLGDDSCLVTLQEGKFHQVKRMLATRGKPVLYLKRLGMGTLRLDETLPCGAWRELTEQELQTLQHHCGL